MKRQKKCGHQHKTEPAKLTPEKIAEWEKTSGRLAAALDLLEEFPVPYPTDCLPVLIF